MKIILTLDTSQTMGQATLSDGKSLPELIRTACETHNELRDDDLKLVSMKFERTPEEEAAIEERIESGSLIPLDEHIKSLKHNEPQMTREEAEAHLEGIEIPSFVPRERLITYMRKMPDEIMINALIHSIPTWEDPGEEGLEALEAGGVTRDDDDCSSDCDGGCDEC